MNALSGQAETRAELAALLMRGADLVKTGNGFDALQPSKSLVSVVVPSYAHEEFVAEALSSITGQTYRDVEVILIDDHSPDRTFERALAVLADSRTPYCAVRTAHAGMDANLNAGIMLAHGGWIAILASDDYFARNSIENLLAAALREHADVAAGAVDDVTREGRFHVSRTPVIARYRSLKGEALRRALLVEHGSLMIQGMLIARHVFSRVGLFTPELIASDFDFLIRMASIGVKFTFVSEATAFHRATRSELSVDRIRRSMESHLAVARRHARSMGEYRNAAATVLCESALNYLHYGHYAHAALALGRAFGAGPMTALGIIWHRAANRLGS